MMPEERAEPVIAADQVAALPSRSGRPPGVWGELAVEGDDVVALFSGWRRILAARRRLCVPGSSVVGIAHDPAARSHVRTGLRRSHRQRFGVMRVGAYHGFDGWSFWSVGVGRNAVVMECSGERYRFVVVEVADPARTVRTITSALGLGRRGKELPPPSHPKQ